MKRKIRWNRVFITLLTIILSIILLHDLFIVIATPAAFTWFGLFTFIILFALDECLIDLIISWTGAEK